jgi:hypothetical protein
MEPGTLEKKIARLPDSLKVKVEGYVDALLDEANKSSMAKTTKPRAQFGDLKGFVKYIADDFDAPLERIS